jgi:hypothetical protein
MIMLDRWEALAADGKFDKETVQVCRELAAEMCRSIFERLGFSVQVIDGGKALRVAGRGLTYIFPTMDKAVSLRSATGAVRPKLPATPRLSKVLKQGEPHA